MPTPKKLPSGNWRTRVPSHKVNGKWQYKSFTAPTKQESLRKALTYQEAQGDMTVKDCVEQYIESRRGVLSPSTIRGYLHDKKYFDSIDNILVPDLTSAEVQYWISQFSADHSPKTVRNVYSLLMSSIKQVDDRRFRVTLPSKRPVEYHTPTDADVNRLLDMANPDLKLAIVLAAVGTLRRGEVCALEYSDVLYDFNAIYVHRDVVMDENKQWVTKEMPKTSGSIRRIQLPKEVMGLIGHGEGRIYKHTPSALTVAFTKLRDSLGLKCRYHDLRHYAASVMHAIGIPDQYIMERGGWASDRILKEVYRNTLDDKSKEFAKRTNEYFSENMTRNMTRKNESA